MAFSEQFIEHDKTLSKVEACRATGRITGSLATCLRHGYCTDATGTGTKELLISKRPLSRCVRSRHMTGEGDSLLPSTRSRLSQTSRGLYVMALRLFLTQNTQAWISCSSQPWPMNKKGVWPLWKDGRTVLYYSDLGLYGFLPDTMGWLEIRAGKTRAQAF